LSVCASYPLHLWSQVTYSVGTSIGRCGQDHGNVKDLTKCCMCHNIVLVQARIPIPGDMVKADLDIENEEQLLMAISLDNNDRCHCHSRSCSCRYAPREQLNHVRNWRHETMEVTLTRPAATRQTVEKSFIMKVQGARS
jgi:hypothetical protein